MARPLPIITPVQRRWSLIGPLPNAARLLKRDVVDKCTLSRMGTRSDEISPSQNPPRISQGSQGLLGLWQREHRLPDLGTTQRTFLRRYFCSWISPGTMSIATMLHIWTPLSSVHHSLPRGNVDLPPLVSFSGHHRYDLLVGREVGDWGEEPSALLQ